MRDILATEGAGMIGSNLVQQSVKIIDIPIEFNQKVILERIRLSINSKLKGYVCTVNANILAEAYYNNTYKGILQDSLINICDGSILVKGISWIFKTKLKAWPGPDFFIYMLKKKEIKNYFLGSNNETLKELSKNLKKTNPLLKNAVFQSLPFLSVEHFDYESISKSINQNKPDIIWVSLGAPKQEIFASLLIPYINQGIIICVGAAFDFYAEENGKKRAPLFIRNLNLEWLWRLFQNPKKTFKRLRREFITLPKILMLEKKKLRKIPTR